MRRKKILLGLVTALVASTVWLGTASADTDLLHAGADAVSETSAAAAATVGAVEAHTQTLADTAVEATVDTLDAALQAESTAATTAEATLPLPPEPAVRVTVAADGTEKVVDRHGKRDHVLTIFVAADTGVVLQYGQDPDCGLVVNVAAEILTDSATVDVRLTRSWTPTFADGSTGDTQQEVLVDRTVTADSRSATVSICAG